MLFHSKQTVTSKCGPKIAFTSQFSVFYGMDPSSLSEEGLW